MCDCTSGCHPFLEPQVLIRCGLCQSLEGLEIIDGRLGKWWSEEPSSSLCPQMLAASKAHQEIKNISSCNCSRNIVSLQRSSLVLLWVVPGPKSKFQYKHLACLHQYARQTELFYSICISSNLLLKMIRSCSSSALENTLICRARFLHFNVTKVDADLVLKHERMHFSVEEQTHCCLQHISERSSQ